MIFVTVGSMLPFDRMVRILDEIAQERDAERFLAQIGPGAYEPRNMAFQRMMSPRYFAETVESARLIVAHAGMGSIIAALEARRPIVLFPRKTSLGEVTTDHQVATARRLMGKDGVYVAAEEADLRGAIDTALAVGPAAESISAGAASAFVEKLRQALM